MHKLPKNWKMAFEWNLLQTLQLYESGIENCRKLKQIKLVKRENDLLQTIFGQSTVEKISTDTLVFLIRNQIFRFSEAPKLHAAKLCHNGCSFN